jgi:hypothetical protein
MNLGSPRVGSLLKTTLLQNSVRCLCVFGSASVWHGAAPRRAPKPQRSGSADCFAGAGTFPSRCSGAFGPPQCPWPRAVDWQRRATLLVTKLPGSIRIKDVYRRGATDLQSRPRHPLCSSLLGKPRVLPSIAFMSSAQSSLACAGHWRPVGCHKSWARLLPIAIAAR